MRVLKIEPTAEQTERFLKLQQVDHDVDPVMVLEKGARYFEEKYGLAEPTPIIQELLREEEARKEKE